METAVFSATRPETRVLCLRKSTIESMLGSKSNEIEENNSTIEEE